MAAKKTSHKKKAPIFDYEDIPFVYADAQSSSARPTDEELSVIAATLHTLFPHTEIRAWDISSRLSALQNKLP